jgi:hypothetical protein
MKFIEDLGQLLLGDADAGVGDGNHERKKFLRVRVIFLRQVWA